MYLHFDLSENEPRFGLKRGFLSNSVRHPDSENECGFFEKCSGAT
ncbi:hypothetical protein HMPREF0542_11122 [Ligilactobacillus ruminis ATCC 25644]|uniref:Uncharacterized protein n=1 Tax=Ligilactobacillus ruminis ATCC 25644 TaxID=525362 RepID=E7FQE5_9LACO|nr:hypothetical protein HMPREF0542_11122 [Ligilactobacillus ruminis ATCC 25644]EGX98622.1 hypothetical protein ANHS_794 [Ligilactobacillus ruminis ATCC 25644]